MQNDKLFITYAMALFFGITTVVTLVLSTGAPSFPQPMYLIEHVALGLMIRAYYKSFDGASGFYAVASSLRNYFGINEEADEMPAGTATATH